MESRGRKLIAMVAKKTENTVVENQKKELLVNNNIMNLSEETRFAASITEMDVIFADDFRTQNFDMTTPIVFQQNPVFRNTTEETVPQETQMEFEGTESLADTGQTEYYNEDTVEMNHKLINQIGHFEPDIDKVGTTMITELQPIQNIMMSCEYDLEHTQPEQLALGIEEAGKTTIITELQPVPNIVISYESNMEDTHAMNTDGITILRVQEDCNLEHSNCGKTDNGEKNVIHRKDKKNSAKNRILGRDYMGYKKIRNGIIQDVLKESRKMGNRCGHNSIKKKSDRTFLCRLISENDRENLFNYFWNLPTWPEKKMYIKGLVSTRNIRKRRSRIVSTKSKNKNVLKEQSGDDTEGEVEQQKGPKKMEGHDIFLPKEDGEKVRVCRIFFLNTFCLGEDTFKRWVKREINKADDVEITICQPPRKTKKIADEQSIKSWLELLPKVPSHYCRKSSKKVYVESVFNSKAQMHREYVKWCLEKQVKPASITLMKKILAKENIAIHRPRKDQCDICCSHKLGHIPEDEYQLHIQRKNDAKTEKDATKANAIANNDHMAITMDLQSVLLCPKTLQSAMYYKCKLQVHNFTIYNLKNGDVTLYVWHEGNGGVTSNEFTTCILDFLCNAKNGYKTISLISDGCGYQNRNRVLSSALRDFAAQHDVTIEQIYLTKGHTMMEADSVHSTLEQLFYPPINSPSDYIARMRVARPKQPYDIKVVHFDFFKKYDSLASNLASLRPGNSVGDPTVADLCKIKYSPEGIIWYKTHFKEDWQKLTQRRQTSTERGSLTPLYDRPLPIPESKFKDLQSLKSAIEKEHHAFYDNLSFKPDKNSKDKLSSGNVAENRKEKSEKKRANKGLVLKQKPGSKKTIEKSQINVRSRRNKK